MQVGKIIRSLRIKQGYNQKTFAAKISVTPTYLSLIEKNKKKPSIDLLEKIGGSLNIPPSIFVYFSTNVDQISPEKKRLFNEINPIIEALIIEIFFDGIEIES